jgi:AraC-like DNA-binding protein
MAVDNLLKKSGLTVATIELGKAVVLEDLTEEKKQEIAAELKNLGFELLSDKRQKTIEKIKTLIISLVYSDDDNNTLKISTYLTTEMGQNYNQLSKLFSEVTGITIERYYVLQKVERVKELISYDELSMTQIALKMHYSSMAYLSSQFKQVTGMTPSQFKLLDSGRRKLDEIG